MVWCGTKKSSGFQHQKSAATCNLHKNDVPNLLHRRLQRRIKQGSPIKIASGSQKNEKVIKPSCSPEVWGQNYASAKYSLARIPLQKTEICLKCYHGLLWHTKTKTAEVRCWHIKKICGVSMNCSNFLLLLHVSS